MSETRKVKVQKKGERKPPHRLYLTFNNIKSAAELAREIVGEQGNDAPTDVRRFLDEFGRKSA